MIIIGLTKSGQIIYRNKHSKCEYCYNYINGYKCWINNFIPVMTWNGSEYSDHICKYFESTITKNHNNCYIHRDYADDNLFPEKKFGQGKYKFDKDGNKI